MERRDFLTITGVAALGTIANPLWAAEEFLAPKKLLDNLGLQLYTVRDDMTLNPVVTLQKIGAIGYKHVESAGYLNGKFYGLARQAYQSLLNDVGLKQHSGHCSIGYGDPSANNTMTNNWEAVCDDAAFMGQKYIVLGWIHADYRKTIDEYKKMAELFNKCGEVAKKYDLQFCFHNHDFEFVKINGQLPYDVLLNETDKNNVKFELDHYWTKFANVDSIKLMKANPGRFPLFHIKDMDKARKFAEAGSGSINFKKIFKSSKTAGMDLYFVEQDSNYAKSAMESIQQSYSYLSKLKV
jgi:sugar phosphate isomerase/epimerase